MNDKYNKIVENDIKAIPSLMINYPGKKTLLMKP